MTAIQITLNSQTQGEAERGSPVISPKLCLAILIEVTKW